MVGVELGKGCPESVPNQGSCTFLSTAFGVLIVGVLGGEASWSLFILTGASQSNVFGVPVNDFLVARKVSGFAIYVAVLL